MFGRCRTLGVVDADGVCGIRLADHPAILCAADPGRPWRRDCGWRDGRARHGATVLVIEAKDQPVNVSLTADNTLSKALGHYKVGVGGDFNSVFGFGELVYIRATAAPELGTNGFLSDYSRNRILAAGVRRPKPLRT